MTAGEGSGSSPFDPTVINENQSCLPERYEILKILGSGGMGRVLHARDRVLDREVAVKFLIDRYASDAVFAQRFLGEARAQAPPAPDHIAGGADAAPMGHTSLLVEFDPTDLAAIEGRLARAIGPVARLLVERESRRTVNRHELLQALAGQIPGEHDRRRFLRECGAEATGGTSAVDSGSRSSPAPIAARALDPELVATVTRHLTESIGPVARVLVKREAAAGGGLADVTRRLADQIPDASARQAFLDAVVGLA